MTEQSTVWRLLDQSCEASPAKDGHEAVETFSLALQADGKIYSVAVSGPPQLKLKDVFGCLRAAGAHALRIYGIDPTLIPGVTLPEKGELCPLSSSKTH